MDNEDKVKELVIQSKNTFLRSADLGDRGISGLYDLETEFAKTKKNRNPIIGLIVFLFIAVFAVSAVIVTNYIQARSTEIPIDIADFQSVNLNELLDTVQKTENDLRVLRRELVTVNRRMEQEIQQIRSDYERQLQILSTQRISEQERQRRAQALADERDAEIEQTRENYSGPITELETEIAALEDQVSAFDTRQLEMAREQEEVLSNERRLFEIERQQLVEDYEEQIDELTEEYEREIVRLEEHRQELLEETRENYQQELQEAFQLYNPVFSEDDVLSVINQALSEEIDESGILHGYRQVLADRDVISNEEFTQLRSSIGELQTVLDRLREIPYQNSVPRALNSLEQIGLRIVRDYEDLWHNVALLAEDRIARSNYLYTQLTRVTYAMDYLIRESGENGYIIDPRDQSNILVYTNQILNLETGDTGYVFRSDDQFIATIEFFYRNNQVRARVEELANQEEPIRPFDIILVDVQ
ncbi:MAG: hypothetical protein ACLFR1_02175 [Spirochaetia bacterium]